ncbi:MAG: hypothetical protein ACYCW6_03195 [Candidatus Xenobia bacterium]
MLGKWRILAAVLIGFLFTAVGWAQQTPQPDDVVRDLYLKSTQTQQYQERYTVTRDDPHFMQGTFPDKGEATVQVTYTYPSHFEVGIGQPNPLQYASSDGYSFIQVGSSNTLPVGHPLAMLLPFNLKPMEKAEQEWNASNPQTVRGMECWVVDETSSSTSIDWTLSLDKKTGVVTRIEYTNPQDHAKIVADYEDFFSEPSAYNLCKKVTVTSNGQPLFSAVSSEVPVVNQRPLGAPAVTATAAPSGPGSHYSLVLVVVLFVLAAVGFFIISYFTSTRGPVLPARPRFGRDIILVDPAGDMLAKVLSKMGINSDVVSGDSVASFPPLVEKQRKLLGRLGKRGVTPKAMVIAPGGFAQIKAYQFILNAYVDEGGRVLVLAHGHDNASTLPFEARFLPYDSEGKVVIRDEYPPRRVSAEDLVKKMDAIAPKELYSEVEGRTFDPELIVMQTGQAGGLALGVIKQGKGEFLFCQYRVYASLTRPPGSPQARNLLLDVLDYLQGLEGEPVPESVLPADQVRARAGTAPPG